MRSAHKKRTGITPVLFFYTIYVSLLLDTKVLKILDNILYSKDR